MEVREIKKLIPAFIFLLLVVSAKGRPRADYQSETIASDISGVERSALRKESQGLSELISGGEVTIYYDYIENGQLKGGVVTTLLPSVNLDSLIGPLSEWPVTTIIDNGPVSNRIDLVFVGDGYTASELGSYATHVQNIVSGYFAEEPMAAYASYFNVHRVDVVSNESGVDELDNSIYRDTALDMAYGCNNTPRLLCIDVGKAVAAASNAPEVELIFALANSTRYGGAGYPDLSTMAGNNSSSVELALHESGHSLAKLADEYQYSDGATYTGPERPEQNVSIYDAAEQIALETKWYRWLDLPNVDTFEGAYYNQYGIYRPTNNSKMRSLGRPFEEINSEQFVINFYKLVSPMDEATPPSQEPLPGDTVFHVIPMEPIDHSLDVQWSVDGVDVPGATGLTFTPTSLPIGIHDVAVTAVDNTTRVREDTARATWLTDTRQWQIEVVPEPDPNASLNGDCFVDFIDLAIFASQLGARDCCSPDWCKGADFEPDFDVDFADLGVLIEQWLLCKCQQCIQHAPPGVNITTSENGEVFYYYGIDAIQIEADAWDTHSLVLKVEFFADEVKIGEDYDGSDGWKINWQNYTPGTYSLTAKATDNLGATMTLPVAKITVRDALPK
ncbi:MAG: M64 family metallopeptidase [candidate division Zixibacteria bacterium]